jgi:hypothetical protein
MVLIKVLVDQCATGRQKGRTRTDRRPGAAHAQGSDALAFCNGADSFLRDTKLAFFS